MIFQVTRSSSWSERKPLEKAFPIKLKRVDERCITSVEEYDNRFQDKWLENGTNHRILENGHIARDVGEVDCWGIEIDTLEELLQFHKEVNEDLILSQSYLDKETYSLEIYDDYRE